MGFGGVEIDFVFAGCGREGVDDAEARVYHQNGIRVGNCSEAIEIAGFRNVSNPPDMGAWK